MVSTRRKTREDEGEANDQQPAPKRARAPPARQSAPKKGKPTQAATTRTVTSASDAKQKQEQEQAPGQSTKSSAASKPAPKKAAASKSKTNPQPQPQSQSASDEQASGIDGTSTSSEARYFLMKAEPESRLENGIDVRFSIDALKERGAEGEPWDGVRNAEASKIMRTEMRVGDLAFFYHSNCKEPGIAGVMKIKRAGYPDDSAWTAGHPYYDAKSDSAKPKWWRVDVEFVRKTERLIGLKELRGYSDGALKEMQLLRRPQLSVQRVSAKEWDFILGLEKQCGKEKEQKKAKGKTGDA